MKNKGENVFGFLVSSYVSISSDEWYNFDIVWKELKKGCEKGTSNMNGEVFSTIKIAFATKTDNVSLHIGCKCLVLKEDPSLEVVNECKRVKENGEENADYLKKS